MTVTQAADVNTLARYLLRGVREHVASPRPTHAGAREALARLTAPAYKRLMAGASPELVLLAWTDGAPPDPPFVSRYRVERLDEALRSVTALERELAAEARELTGAIEEVRRRLVEARADAGARS